MKLLFVGLLLGLPSCLFASAVPSLDDLRIGEVRQPELVERTTRHPHTGVVLRTWSEWLLPSGRVERHGFERTWYPSGPPEWRREFDHGTPVGHWQGWHENGIPMAESFHGTEEATTMSFWHDNGQLAAQGAARNGVRQGPWKHWYSSGVVRSEGEYADGLRSGPWSFYREDGTLDAEGICDRGERVGAWKLGSPSLKFELPKE